MSSDYKVGYKHPPKETRFQPGQSGNPRGRSKGVKNLATDLEEEFSESVIVNEGGKQLVITKQRAMLKALLSKALKGDARAANALINLKLGLEQTDATRVGGAALSEEDKNILAEYEACILRNAKSTGE